MQPINLTPAQHDLLRARAQELAQMRAVIELKQQAQNELVGMLVRDSGQPIEDGEQVTFGLAMNGDQPLLVVTPTPRPTPIRVAAPPMEEQA